ncbi:MAG: extracellular solute-binding protein [Desulfobacterales bacterium]|nr:extracellular solute-binding protein [Desulfobacterales bacterium]
MKRRMNVWLFLIICNLTWVARPFYAHADPFAPYREGAKKEGSVTLGITLRDKVHGKPAGQRYLEAFKKHYPFLKVTFKRIGGAPDRERIINEMSAGVFNYDVATVGAPMIPTIVNAGLPLAVDYKKLGVPDFLSHPDNLGVALRTPVFGIAYNRDRVPEQEAKTFTWETCLDPKWKGKTSVNARPRHLNIMVLDEVWGREKTLDYARRWAANKPVVETSRSTQAAKLMSGAYPLICGVPRDQVKDLQVYAGAKNIGIVFPEPVPVGSGELIYVPQKARHPNAGILFLAWTATQEAQNLLDDINFSGHPAFEGNEINTVLKGKKVAYTSFADTVAEDDHLAEIVTAMGMPVVRTKKKKK